MKTHSSKSGRRNGGFTLVELTISVTLGALVMSAALQVIADGQSASDAATTTTELDEQMRRGLDEAADQVRSGAAGSHLVETSTAGAPAGRLVFETTVLPPGEGALPFTVENWIELVPPPGDPWNGVDDDQDGLIDEGRLVWIRDPGLLTERRVNLCDGISRAGDDELPGDGIDQDGDGVVDERGLEIVIGDAGVLLRLSVEGTTADGGELRRSAQRWIHPRN